MARCARASPGAASPREELGSPPASSAASPAPMALGPQLRGARPRPALKVALPPAPPGRGGGGGTSGEPVGWRWAAPRCPAGAQETLSLAVAHLQFHSACPRPHTAQAWGKDMSKKSSVSYGNAFKFKYQELANWIFLFPRPRDGGSLSQG